MDIDLLFTSEGHAGLICRGNLVKKAAGVLFDPASGLVTLEYVDMDYAELNIPVEPDFHEAMDFCSQIHVGGITEGHISQAYQVSLMFQDDPYRSEITKKVQQAERPLVAFDAFVRKCVAGQPVHREDLGNEDAMGCVLGSASPSSLEFAPHLARRHALEIGPKAAPTIAPGMGLGGSGGGQVQSTTTQNTGQAKPSGDSDAE